MLELLNKFSWFLSFALCFAVCSAIFGREMMDGGFIVAIIAAFVVKGFVFPKDYILARLQFFKTQILKGEHISEDTYMQQEKIELEVDDNDEEIDYNTKENKDTQEEENIYLDTPVESQDITVTHAYAEAEELHQTEIIEKESQKEIDISETQITTQYAYESDTSKKIATEKRELNVFEKFFAENLLAKLGGIFVFLGVLFLLGLVYTIIGPITKLILGFIVGGMCYISGVWLDKKGYTQESRIVLGVAILINYLVILWGRYYLGSDVSSGSTILSVGVTFFFLICNTIIAIITSQIYNSRALLIFAFVAAYINPFLLGDSSSEPYTLLGYTMIVTLGAMYMSYQKKDEVLFPLSFVFAAILILIAPWSDGSGWVTKLLCINTLGALGLYVSTEFKDKYKFGFEVLISGTFFLIGLMGVLGGEYLSQLQYIIMSASSLGLMATCYIFMYRGVYLYSIGTVGTILTLTPVILQNGLLDGYGLISSIIVVAFGIMNIGIALVQPKKLIAENIRNTISGLVSGALFVILMIYILGNQYLTADIQGILFFGLSLVYAGVSYVWAQNIGIKNISINKDYENLIYSIFSLGISLFTLAVAFIFAENKAVVSIAWLLEANVLFYLASRIKSQKVALLGIVLLIIGVIKFIDFTDITNIFTNETAQSYGNLVSFFIIFISYALNLAWIKDPNSETKSYLGFELTLLHNLFHVIGMGFLLLWGHQIIGISDNWISLLYYSSAIMILGVIYEKLLSPGLQKVHLGAYLAIMGIHILLFFSDIGTDRLQVVLSTLIAGIYSLPFVYDFVMHKKIRNENLFSVFIGYILTLICLYLYHIFGTSFVATSYWGVLIFSFIGYNMSKNTAQLSEKTIAIYLLPMAIISILFYETLEIGTVLLFLGSLIVFFYAHRTKSLKNAVIGLIFMAIGVLVMIDSLVAVQSYSYIMAGLVILLSLISSLLFTQDESKSSFLPVEFIWSYNIVHVVGMIVLAIWGHDVIGIINDWISLLYFSTLIMILGVVYEKIASVGIQKIHIVAYFICMWIHILLFFNDIGTDKLNILISSIVVLIYSLPFAYDYLKNENIQNKNLFYIFIGYILTLTSLYLYHIFGTSFVVTSFWALIIFSFIGYYVSQNNKHLSEKTITMYLFPMAIISVLFHEALEIGNTLLFLGALILFFYAHRIKSLKNAVIGLILMGMGVVLIQQSLLAIKSYSYIMAGFIMLLSVLSSLLFIKNDSESLYISHKFIWVYNFIHIIGITLLLIWGHSVLAITNDWISLLYFSTLIMILGVVYEKIASVGIQKIHIVTYILMMGTHIMLFIGNIQPKDMNLLLSTLVVGIFSLPFIYEYIRKRNIENKPLFMVFLSYLFILTSLYVYQIFGVTFMVTLYWGLLAFSILWYGIARDFLAVRTIGLYLITLTATKVFLYDIWMSVDDTVSRVVALIVVGVLMIVLSTMYTKKFGNNLNAEFKLSNLFPKDNEDTLKKYTSSKVGESDQEKVEFKSTVQKDIEKIDVSQISSVKLKFKSDEKSVSIRAENLIKIAKLITNTYKKTEFKPGELEKAYKLIESDYKSDLSPAQYTKIRSLVKRFVETGGSIELIKK